METEKSCASCGVMFDTPAVIFEFAGVDIVLRQQNCNQCIKDFEAKTSTPRVNLEDLLESINESI
jgi:hypothetical protein